MDLTPLSNKHLLLHNRDYPATAAASCFAASPTAIHFSGFQTGSVLTRHVRIINKGAVPARIHVLPAESSHFRITLVNKRGGLAPGMAETVEVQFSPTAYEYHYEAVKIHCGVCLARPV